MDINSGHINHSYICDTKSFNQKHPSQNQVRQRSRSSADTSIVYKSPHQHGQRSRSFDYINTSKYHKNLREHWTGFLFSKEFLPLEENDNLNKSKDKEVPDGGWGWFILLSSFMIQFIVIGFDGASGILFLKFTDRYKQSAAITAWLGSLATALRLSLGPLASGLSNRFTERVLIMASGVILALSMVLTGLSPNVIYVFLSFGICGGIGRSFAYCPAIVMLGIYFKKKQGIVTGIAASGCGVGRFAMSLLVPLLFRYFDFRGAFISMGGIALQIVVMGALMRPLSVTKTKIISEGNKGSNVRAELNNNGCNLSSVAVTIPEDKILNNEIKEKIISEKDTGDENKTPIFNFALLKEMRFLGFCITMLLSSLAEQSAFVFLPAFSEEIGVLGNFSSEYTLAITSVFNTFAKVLAGFVFDCGFVRPYRVYLYNALMFGLVIVSFAIPSVKTFTQLAIACALYGMFSGSYTAQKSVVIVDILGRDKLKYSYGILMMFQGIGVFIGPPLSGLVKDINGRYDVAFYIGGVGMLVGSMILFINNVVHYVKSKNNTTKGDKPGTLPHNNSTNEDKPGTLQKTIQISVIPADNLIS
ncbi:monocarboxylate transporter 12-B-like [Mytilus trossulus]|uniref:monocarboxylate transporter 12-B-like n=1 Tax=Mytilus trossulus TaxID=6551 RepID=UPI003004395B